jgi:hypothetical protein
MTASPERPLAGVRLLLLSADPAIIEPLTVALEDAGAELSIRFVAGPLPEPETLDGVVLHDSFGVEHWDSLQAFLAGLPSDVAVVDAGDHTLEELADQLPTRAALTPAVEPEVWEESEESEESEEADEPAPISLGSGRLLRAALTVVAVTGLLWLVFGRFAQAPEQPSPGAPLTGVGQDQTGAGQLAGRVTRSDTNGSIGGATVVATGPSGPIATITDAQGQWRFTGLRGGSYVVMSTVARFRARQVQVDVPEGRAVENVHLSLDPEGP